MRRDWKGRAEQAETALAQSEENVLYWKARAKKAEADMGAWGYYSDEAKEKAREAYRELLGRALIAEARAEKAEAALERRGEIIFGREGD